MLFVQLFFCFFWGSVGGRLKGNNPSKRLDLSSTIQRRTTCELKQKLTTRTRVTCLDETEIIPPPFSPAPVIISLGLNTALDDLELIYKDTYLIDLFLV